MKYLPVSIFVALVFIGLPTAGAQSSLSEALIEEIETRISQEMSRQGIPGMSLAIAVDERIRYVNGFGQSDVENLVPTRATTAYRTASIAKPMTSAVVMRLRWRTDEDDAGRLAGGDENELLVWGGADGTVHSPVADANDDWKARPGLLWLSTDR